jgi:hypothetical protein
VPFEPRLGAFQVRDLMFAPFVRVRAVRRVAAPLMPVAPARAAPATGIPFVRIGTEIPARSPATPGAPRARSTTEAPFFGFGATAGATPAAAQATAKAALKTAFKTAPEARWAEAASEAPAKRPPASAPVAEEHRPGKERRMRRTPPPRERATAPALLVMTMFLMTMLVMNMLVLVVLVTAMLVLAVFVMMAVGISPSLLVSLAAPGAAPPLCLEIVVIIFA